MTNEFTEGVDLWGKVKTILEASLGESYKIEVFEKADEDIERKGGKGFRLFLFEKDKTK